jgi:Arm DNA-binding domain
MPRIRLTKSAIDALLTPVSDIVYWDNGCPGFGVKVAPKGRKVFIVHYRTGGAGSRLRKYTIGSYGRVTLHQARVAAQNVFAAKLDGPDAASEKREAKRRVVADRVEDLLETFIAQHLSSAAAAALGQPGQWRCPISLALFRASRTRKSDRDRSRAQRGEWPMTGCCRVAAHYQSRQRVPTMSDVARQRSP